MENKSVKILDRLNVAMLERLKSEAELIFDELIATENIIIGKANTFFQIFIVMLISIIGYLISLMPCIDISVFTIQACLIFGTSLCVSIAILLKIIYPTKTKLKGSFPSSLLQSDIFDGSDFETENFLSNRVLSLDRDITEKKTIQTKHIKLLKSAVWSVLFGLLVVIIVAIFSLCV
jgi:hypothetical protein